MKNRRSAKKEGYDELVSDEFPRALERFNRLGYANCSDRSGEDDGYTSQESGGASRCSKSFAIGSSASQGDQKENGGEKDRIAPRSGLQFKVGPPFMSTKIETDLFNSSDTSIIPKIKSRIDRGFELNPQGEWIGYKRNYFTLVTAFGFSNLTREQTIHDRFHILDGSGNRININFFALRIISRCCEDNATVSLVQHTAKRDKGPQISPPIYPALPGSLPSHDIIKKTANIRNNEKIENLNRMFFLDVSEDDFPGSMLDTYPPGPISIAARYERIQFSTAINCRKYSTVNRHFVLGVQLLGFIEDDQSVVLAHSSTPPLIVRGRSPSNYQVDSKRKEAKAKVDYEYLSMFKSKSGEYSEPRVDKSEMEPPMGISHSYRRGDSGLKQYYYDSEDENISDINFPISSSILPPIEDYLNTLKGNYSLQVLPSRSKSKYTNNLSLDENEDLNYSLGNHVPRDLNFLENDEITKEYLEEPKLTTIDSNRKRTKHNDKHVSKKASSTKRKPFNEYYIDDAFKSDFPIKEEFEDEYEKQKEGKGEGEEEEDDDDDEDEECLRFQRELEECKYKYVN
ncbi:meiosis-specific transcription factor Ndt80p [[Candida] railenensis]|uniref:Meiosis-specific transcription factor Ndt80p n=1 Tax=[Candida] railenensis TaxID=45579 RepID=A0A9P0VVN4_9ASCO|nr:meiosis-specific transcription factor Ndt80p [[Candida] railenensis]